MNPILTKITHLIKQSASEALTDTEFIEKEIARWRISPERALQIKGTMYCAGDHDILRRKRTAIGERGMQEEVGNLPNNRVVYNLYGKMVTQKVNYLLGKPFVLHGDNPLYINALSEVFDKKFMRTLKNAGKAALNGGISWLYIYYDNESRLRFRLFPAYEILPFWKDTEHTEAEAAVRLYQVEVYDGKTPELREKVEIYTENGVKRFIYRNGKLIPDTDAQNPDHSFPYAAKSRCEAKGGAGLYRWKQIPLIPIKCCEREIPLLKRVKSLQDGLNLMLSDFENNMQEDARNTILVLKNYDGTNLGEFRKNLAAYGAVKVRCDGDAQGGVETLEVKVDPDNYKAIIGVLKEGIVENSMGFNPKEGSLYDKGYGTPNQLNVKSMYTDIDLDANDMETELQAAFEQILPFVNTYLYTSGKGNFQKERAEIIFNRDMLINESEVISNCISSLDVLSKETVVAQHPWVNDPDAELKRLRAQSDAKVQTEPKAKDTVKA
ncbi:MAG: phage portal protein [Ruminococcaceae bacterium]|nr:phage portal protein [Oscillospiraceae bacterium]